ncbi:uncharacterized protein DSM5745_02088 [Aspergillus mulundensis]|uniref:Carrier domain-containing protein n=1 Tax=Aspergillus mulundensis TaxID=1810919 RepID=A0A3D8SVG6_9EURO|nr:Uncharacterized protein DSM5745_02088 [Aspergillus mulundensis]RDW90313.1 Uncharacterized protein DSM5745_02088 [Aspergillus mulundensis]
MPEPIAIIGSGCRFPGQASSPSKLWTLLSQPRDVLSKINRFSADGFYNKDGHHHGSSNVLHSYQIDEDTRAFDAQFFNIPASEAESMDPQQRFLMEVVYEAIEASGHKIEDLAGSEMATAAYVGVMCNDYAHITYADLESVPKYAATGTALSILSNRLSYFFNWTGPSMTIDTACSSSLVALHHAVQTLREGNSKVAVAAGANLIFTPTNYIAESNVNMLSPTGRSRMWDADADGYARGEGVAAVVLKTLSQAIADGDPIECVIRETGLNQDGRTTGITMPSNVAQAELIRSTYKRAGLDLNKQADRPQFFEAHGTGTKAGDPQEAGAIYRAYFGQGENTTDGDAETLYVGSIKTIIGHTEGTAGLAGLLKVSLAIQNRTLPPNMHFHTLNPDIEPYYGKLQILTSAKPWPALAPGVPRRASVNSFGFGGANAHAIVESYDPPSNSSLEICKETMTETAIPYTFSGYSEKALMAQLTSFVEYLDTNPEKLRDVAWTLSRRSAFAIRTTVSGNNVETLKEKLQAKIDGKNKDGKSLGLRASVKNQKILGVFTGQGAQWPKMGLRLLQSSATARHIFDSLEKSLVELPEEDRPSWSLSQELQREAEDSRVMEGQFSQVLCTAVQIMLVDLLHSVGVSFDGVVGHSSGEIAAAYAAGYLSSNDAIRVAYYRGKFGKLAHGRDGTSGGMLAAGTDMADATELCELEDFEGRLQVAASNSSSSVTLSGDADAVHQAQFILEDEKKFARLLKVDTAYHSYHMQPCAEPYVDAMKRAGVRVLKAQSKKSCRWFSSVLGGQEVGEEVSATLADTYWRDNLLQPVLFSQALEAAVTNINDIGLVLEVGPHAALKGPATLTITDKLARDVPYTGLLSRNTDDVEAFSDAIGAVWASMSQDIIDFAQVDALLATGLEDKPGLCPGVPGYTWDHSRKYWMESRSSSALRLRPAAHHELLGVRVDSLDREFRWRNFIKPSQLSWTKGHQVQSQLIFPGAGFSVMAIEAAKALVPEKEIGLVELSDVQVLRAMAFQDENTAVEVVCSLTNVVEAEDQITANFTCDICLSKESGFTMASCAAVRLQLQSDQTQVLPERTPCPVRMNDVNIEHFYSTLWSLGYNYTDMFRSITSLQRTTDTASGVIHTTTEAAEPGYTTSLILHPATLDVAFQGIFGAMGAPGDGRLWTVLVPTRIKRITIDPTLCSSASFSSGLNVSLPFDASVSVSPIDGVAGDVDIFNPSGINKAVQVEGLQVSPLAPVTENDDKEVFSDTTWALQEPNAAAAGNVGEWKLTEQEWEHARYVERACFFYLKQLVDAITPEEREKCEWHPKKMLDWATEVVGVVARGEHPIVPKEWMDDTWEMLEGPLDELTAKYSDFESLTHVGKNLIPFVRGEFSLLELVRNGGLLEHIYRNTYAFAEYNECLAGLVKQLSHRFPRMDIFEIGAGTGSTTEAVLQSIGDHYSSYTYTDVSAGFFLKAQEHAIFKQHAAKMIYKTYDAEKEPCAQGHTERSYDLIIASNVLHATHSLETTLSNARKLLKPGGYLVVLEVTDINPLRPTFFFGCLPGWWVGENDGRPHHPLVTKERWGQLFEATGFSGLDTATPDHGVFMAPFSVMLTQAVDRQMGLIRQPLQTQKQEEDIKTTITIDNLLILGGGGYATYDLIEDIQRQLELNAEIKQVTVVETVEALETSHFHPRQMLLSLVELDRPVFSPFTPERFAGLQLLTEKCRNVLWVVQGASGEQPYANMMNGVARCLVGEQPDMRFQFLDFDVADKPDAEFIVKTLLRLQISDAWNGFREPYRPAWTLEREIRVRGGQVHIPRYAPSARRNLQYNSWRRTVREPVDLHVDTERVVVLTNANGHFDLEEDTSPSPVTAAENVMTINVSRSFTKAVEIDGVGHLYILTGECAQSKQRVLAFARQNASQVQVQKDWVFNVESIPGSEEAALLQTLANVCLGTMLLSRMPQTGQLLVHEPSVTLARTLIALTSGRVSFTTANRANLESGMPFVFIHPSSPENSIARRLPADIAGFVDASEGQGLGRTIARQLESQPQVRVLSITGFYSTSSRQWGAADGANLQALLRRATDLFTQIPKDAVEELSLDEVIQRTTDGEIEILNWKSQPKALVKLSPVQDEITFRGDRTYLLVGLTGELGRSLCRWMVQRGARYVVLTSRKPDVEAAWLELMQSYGARVEIMAMDATSRKSTYDVVRKIRQTLPPVAGVGNGAMILNDGLFNVISHEDFNQTLRPKVDGTTYLNELFDSPDLDFFIVFSSLAYVTGNFGQTSYAAANGFMASLVEGRRKRGLPGSVMNLAGIFGIGYITRTDRSILERLGKLGYANISEYDFLQFFAEAVLAGIPGSGRDHEVSSALRPIDPDRETNPPAWLDMPRLSYYRHTKHVTAEGGDSKSLSVRSQLKEQTTMEDVQKVLTNGLISTLYKQLGLDPEDDAISPDTSLVELGIDSLVAVDMRVWFTKELDLDMPVLKLLGGASVAAMVEDTMERMSPDLIPKVARKDTATADAPSADEKVPVVEVTAVPQEEGVSAEETQEDESTSNGESSSTEEPSLSSKTTPPSSSVASEDFVKIEKPVSLDEPKYVRKAKMGYGSLQFFFLVKHLDDPTVLNMQFRLPLRGSIRLPDLKYAVQLLGQRHEALRTAFFVDADNDDEPTQGVLETSPLRLETIQVADADEAKKVCEDVQNYVFDIEAGETIRILLLSFTPTTHLLVLAFHHISIDGFSFNVLLDELNSLYQGKMLPSVTTQFTDVMIKQRNDLQAGYKRSELAYWRNILGKIPDPIPLFPVAKVSSRLPMTKYHFNEAPMASIDAATAEQIRKQCRALKATRFHFFMTVLRVFLFAFLDTDELCIGFADASRADPSVARTVGYLVNMLSLKFERKPNQTFAQKVEEARKQSYAALANSTVPFNALLEKLEAPRSAAYTPVFQVFMDYLQHKFTAPEGLGVVEDEVYAHLTHNFFDLAVDINDVSASEILIRFRMQQYLYDTDSVALLLKSYVQLVQMCAYMEPTRTIGELALYDKEDIQHAEKLGRGPVVTSQWPSTPIERILEVATTQPEAPALVDGEGAKLSYAETVDRSRSIAATLLDAGVTKGSIVGVYQEPTADSICSLLAIWMVGAVYLPLDRRVPCSRLSRIVQDCQPAAILCHERTFSDAPGLEAGQQTSILTVSASGTDSGKMPLPSIAADGNETSIILYTSGSTGVPKGLPIRHISLLNQVEAMTTTFRVGSEKVLQQSAPSFDVSMQQILMALCNGGTLYVVPGETRLDPLAITKLIQSEQITWAHATPSEYAQWLRHGSAHLSAAKEWKFAFSSGEALSNALVKEFQALNRPDIKLVNVYGPAEAGVITGTEISTTDVPVDPRAPVSLGSPLANMAVYVVDRNLQPVPAGMSGEIVIAGAGNIPGYLNRPELTTKLFVRDAITPAGYYPGQLPTIYRSGDIGRYSPDGQLYYEGRMAGDTQVKLNGIRIDLSDVEAAILETAAGAVVNAIVTDRRNPDFLVAHVELKADIPEAERKEFLTHIQQRLPLPKYMCPAMLISLDHLPLNSHGKLDRRAIAAQPLPTVDGLDQANGDDLSETELTLRELWAGCLPEDVVKSASISTSSDFFHLGGNSYLLVRLQRLIRDRFNVSVPVMALYDASTLAAMALKIRSSESLAVIDWDAETSVPETLAVGEPSTHRKTTNLTVVLTGATGYLGSRVLTSLIANEHVTRIHCVAVRGHSPDVPRELAHNSDKITIHAGHLEDPLLSMSEGEFSSVAAEADLVIHSGANRSFWDHYDKLRGPNVLSTKTLVDLALQNKAPLHFISSGGVHLLNPGASDNYASESVASCPPPTDGSNGYIASKWASEVYLENVAQQTGLPVHIHRLTPAPEPESDADTNADAPVPMELLEELSALVEKLQALPAPSGWTGSFDLTPANALGADIASAAVGQVSDSDAARFIHHPAQVKMTMDHVVKYMDMLQLPSVEGFERLPPLQWAGKAKREGFSWHFSSTDFVSMGGVGVELRR